MGKPVVHNETWAIVSELAARWGEPEWKVMHLAAVLLRQTAQTRPEVAEILRAVEGSLGPHAIESPLKEQC